VNSYSLSHLSDGALLRDLAALVSQDRATTAALLAHLAEVDARKLYLPAAHPSMYAYCVGELGLCEQAAYKRILAARSARQFPAIFAAVADGRLHLSAVVLLAPYLTPENAHELLTAAAHQSKGGIEELLAQRFPRPDVPAQIRALSPSLTLDAGQLSPGIAAQLAPGQVEPHAPGRVEPPAPRRKLAALAPQRFALQLTIGQSTYDKLQYAQGLLGHQLAPGDLAAVLDRALDALIGHLERRKFAATAQPRPRPRRATPGKRHIPAEVRRAVWARDGGQCTFVSTTGRRCPARSRLEFDHLDEVARGGQATVANVRLRCRSHNQFAAECTFGTAFMSHKRQEAQRAAAARAAAGEQGEERDVVPWLRQLGFRADEARRAASVCESIPDASLEERLRLALSCLRPPHRRVAEGLGRSA
jgi:hypothetical protein